MSNVNENRVYQTLVNTPDCLVRLVCSEKNWLETAAVDQLKHVGTLPGMRAAIGMPDLHPGRGQPIGAAFLAESVIYPHLVGSDVGCGMALWQLAVPARKLKLEKWSKQLQGLDDAWQGSPAQWLADAGLDSKGAGVADFDPLLGTIGGGNHFAEILQVAEVFNPAGMAPLGLQADGLALLVHSGSRGLGQRLLREHVDQCASAGLRGSAAESYVHQHNFADQWAVQNRRLIAHRICTALGFTAAPLLDISHNHVRAVSAAMARNLGVKADANAQYWLHRKGASPVDQGIVMIPGSRGSLSYLVRPKLESVSAMGFGGFSLAHGAGRKWKRSECRGRLERRYRVSDLESTVFGGRVICKQRDLLYEEAPQAYKNIDLVIADLVAAGMVDLLASFKPLLTYKTARS